MIFEILSKEETTQAIWNTAQVHVIIPLYGTKVQYLPLKVCSQLKICLFLVIQLTIYQIQEALGLSATIQS